MHGDASPPPATPLCYLGSTGAGGCPRPPLSPWGGVPPRSRKAEPAEIKTASRQEDKADRCPAAHSGKRESPLFVALGLAEFDAAVHVAAVRAECYADGVVHVRPAADGKLRRCLPARRMPPWRGRKSAGGAGHVRPLRRVRHGLPLRRGA